MICPVCNNKFDFLRMPLKKDPKAGNEKGRILCPKCGASLRMQYESIFGLNFQQLIGIFIGIIMLGNYLNYAFFGNNDIVALIINVGGFLSLLYLSITYIDKYATAVEAEKFPEQLEERDQAIKNLSNAANEAIFKGDERKKKIALTVLKLIIAAVIIFSVLYPVYKNNPQDLPESLGIIFLLIVAYSLIMLLVRKHMK